MNNENERPIPIINIDADPRNADWIKFRWHIPAYKSPEFMDMIRGQFPQLTSDEERLAQFRTLPIYQFAVDQGRIVNDEWFDAPDRVHRSRDLHDSE